MVLNKDGSFQRTMRFRGPDLDSATAQELVAATARLNNALKRLGQGWAIYVEAERQPIDNYPTSRFGGTHVDLGAELGASGDVAFQPLRDIDEDLERSWAADWIAGLLAHEHVAIDPGVKAAVWTALGSLASADPSERTLTGFTALLSSGALRDALAPYTLAGPHGRLLDAETDRLADADVLAFEMEALMHAPSAVLPVLTYLFHRLEARFDGSPTLMILDEAWVFLDDPLFAGRIREWLKVLRKKNVAVIFATQSLADIQSSSIAPALIESCPSRIFLPNLRLQLTDRSIAHLPFAEGGQYFAFDEKLAGFHVVVGRKRKTFMVRSEIRAGGKRVANARVTIGDCDEVTVAKARTIAEGYLSEMRQGRHPKPDAVKRLSAVADMVEKQQSADGKVEATDGPTLRQAWERYKAAMIKKGRSEGTIAGYEDHVTRVLKIWIDTPLKELAEDQDLVAKKHDAITLSSGPYGANGAMRTLRAIYNHAWLKNRKVLPRDNPVDAVDWNKERRRNSGMGVGDLPGWFNELARFENPIRREFHLMTLLSASRPAALKRARREHLDLKRRVLHIPAPKGGEDRAFDIPLSREMIRSLMRVIRFGRAQHPVEARIWLFPAESKAGHIYTTQEDRADLSKWGNDLRQTYRTLATVAKVNGVDAKLLMNHAIPGVNEGYITRDKILEDHLRQQQQAISDIIFAPISELREKDGPVATWLRPRSARTQIAAAQETKTAYAHLHEVRRRKALMAREYSLNT